METMRGVLAFAAALGCNSVLGIDEATLCSDGSCDGGVPSLQGSNPPGAGGASSNGSISDAGASSDASAPLGSSSAGSSSAGSGESGVPTNVMIAPSQSPPADMGSGSGAGNDPDDNSGSGNPGGGNADPGNPGSAGSSSGGGSGDDDDDPPPVEPPTSPPPPPSACQGRVSGAAFCDGATRIACGPAGAVTSTLVCPSVDHCQQASGAICAACLTGEARCEGAVLSVCNADHSGFVAQACSSAALCNVAQARCDAPVCTANQARCAGAVLEVCNATLTGFDSIDCSPAACNPTTGRCNLCTPGASRCVGSRTVATCDATGQNEVQTDCGVLETCSSGVCQVLGLPL
jgi:hypothetical protein